MIKHAPLISMLVAALLLPAAANAQIIFDIDNMGSGGIKIFGSGSAVVPPKSTQYYNLGVLDFGCGFVDESFQDLCLNGHQTTINGNPWAFGLSGIDTSDQTGSGVQFNGVTLDVFGSFPTAFALSSSQGAVIPDTDGVTPISASGSMAFPHADFSLLPGAPGFGQTTIISLFGEGNIIFRLNGGGAFCNGFQSIGTMITTPTTYQVCENATLGTDVIIEETGSLNLYSGEDVEFLTNFLVETGATLQVFVCGQSLCEASEAPMPLGCHPCVDQICAIDPDCCSVSFDQSCQDRVRTTCGQVCQ